MSLLTIDQFCAAKGISRRTYFNWQEKGTVKTIGDYVYTDEPLFRLTAHEKQILLESKTKNWNDSLANAHNLYIRNNKPTKETTTIIQQVESEASLMKRLGFEFRGFDKRSLQLKVKHGRTERKRREEREPIRRQFVKDSLPKAMELIFNLYFERAIPSVNEAIDKAILYAKQHEEYWEVAGCQKYIYTLRRHIKKAIKQSGFKNLHEYLNHYNQFRKKLAYVKGAFTNDIEFMDVISLDDHKFDVAGVIDYDEIEGKPKKKQIYSWFVVEMKTMYPLDWEIKTTPFTGEDIIRLLMRTYRRYGKPKWKVIYDNGRVVENERVAKFHERLGVFYEAQEAYSPTQKSPNERLYGLVKNEQDVYANDFVGSNHPVEGRHRGRQLSPEETLIALNHAAKRYEHYITGELIDRPRLRDIKGIDHLVDNTKRVTIRTLYDFYYQNHTPQAVTDTELRYAYMKYDVVKSFQNFYIKFKKEIYIPAPESHVSLVLNDPSYKFVIAYDPMDLNKIDMYSMQYIEDYITGEVIEKGKRVCTLESLAALDADEKKKRVAVYNKRIKKAYKELAVSHRDKYALNKDIANSLVGDEGLIDVRKQQIKQVEHLLKNSTPVQQIEIAIQNDNCEEPDYENALSEEAIAELNNIKVGNGHD